jgi:hypothetical protein
VAWGFKSLFENGVFAHLAAEAQVSLTILDQSSRRNRNFADCPYAFVNPQDVYLPDVSYQNATSDIIIRALPVAESVREIELPVWDSSGSIENLEGPFTGEILGPISNRLSLASNDRALVGDPQLLRSIGNKASMTEDEATPVAEPGGARSARRYTSPPSCPSTPMPEERNTVRPTTESRHAFTYVEGYVPWEDIAIFLNMLRIPDVSDSQINVRQPKDPPGYRKLDKAQDRAILRSSTCDRDDTQGKFCTSKQRSNGPASQFALERLTGSIQHPRAIKSCSASTFGQEPCQSHTHFKCFIESRASITSPSYGSQSSVPTGSSSVTTIAQSAATGTNSLSCMICHKSFSRPCELTYVI